MEEKKKLDELEEKDAPKEEVEPPKAKDVPPEPPAPTEETPPSEECIMLRAQLAAVKSGMDASVAEDAVYLAMRDAQKAGAADEAGIEKALKDVLKRHPEWGAKAAPQTGFKIGAESQEQKTGSNAIAEAEVPQDDRWLYQDRKYGDLFVLDTRVNGIKINTVAQEG